MKVNFSELFEGDSSMRGKINYTLSFPFNGKLQNFESNSLKDISSKIFDWLYSNNYNFEGRIHNSSTKKLLTKNELDNLVKTTSYGYRSFHNIGGSNNFLINSYNSNIMINFIIEMLVNFGIEQKSISYEGFADLYTKYDSETEPEEEIQKFSNLFPSSFRAVQAQEEREKVKSIEPVNNPFMQAVCILGKSGRGKSTTIDNMLESYPNMEYDFIIPTASTTGLLSQFSPTSGKTGGGGYIPSRLGKMIMDARNNPEILYTAVFDECHKASIIEMINDELLQCISTERNKGNRFISLDTETESLFSGLKDYRGNLLLPDNFGFIFLSSKPDVITSNDDFFRRVNIYILKKVDDYDSIDYLDMVRETGEKDKNGKPTYRLNEEYFTFVEGKSKEDIQQIEKLNDEE